MGTVLVHFPPTLISASVEAPSASDQIPTVEHWMISLLQGTAGALIGMIGLFTVFMLTKKHETRRDGAARAIQEKKEAEDRLQAEISLIIQHCMVIRTKLVLDDYAEGVSVANDLLMVYIHEMRRNPELAEWAKDQSITVFQCLEPDQNAWALRLHIAGITSTLLWWKKHGNLGAGEEVLEKRRAAREKILADSDGKLKITRIQADELPFRKIKKRALDWRKKNPGY